MAEQNYPYPTPEQYRDGTEFTSDTHIDLHQGDPRLSSVEVVRARALAEAAAVATERTSEKSLSEIEKRNIQIAEVKSRNIVKSFRVNELEAA